MLSTLDPNTALVHRLKFLAVVQELARIDVAAAVGAVGVDVLVAANAAGGGGGGFFNQNDDENAPFDHNRRHGRKEDSNHIGGPSTRGGCRGEVGGGNRARTASRGLGPVRQARPSPGGHQHHHYYQDENGMMRRRSAATTSASAATPSTASQRMQQQSTPRQPYLPPTSTYYNQQQQQQQQQQPPAADHHRHGQRRVVADGWSSPFSPTVEDPHHHRRYSGGGGSSGRGGGGGGGIMLSPEEQHHHVHPQQQQHHHQHGGGGPLSRGIGAGGSGVFDHDDVDDADTVGGGGGGNNAAAERARIRRRRASSVVMDEDVLKLYQQMRNTNNPQTPASSDSKGPLTPGGGGGVAGGAIHDEGDSLQVQAGSPFHQAFRPPPPLSQQALRMGASSVSLQQPGGGVNGNGNGQAPGSSAHSATTATPSAAGGRKEPVRVLSNNTLKGGATAAAIGGGPTANNSISMRRGGQQQQQQQNSGGVVFVGLDAASAGGAGAGGAPAPGSTVSDDPNRNSLKLSFANNGSLAAPYPGDSPLTPLGISSTTPHQASGGASATDPPSLQQQQQQLSAASGAAMMASSSMVMSGTFNGLSAPSGAVNSQTATPLSRTARSRGGAKARPKPKAAGGGSALPDDVVDRVARAMRDMKQTDFAQLDAQRLRRTSTSLAAGGGGAGGGASGAGGGGLCAPSEDLTRARSANAVAFSRGGGTNIDTSKNGAGGGGRPAVGIAADDIATGVRPSNLPLSPRPATITSTANSPLKSPLVVPSASSTYDGGRSSAGAMRRNSDPSDNSISVQSPGSGGIGGGGARRSRSGSSKRRQQRSSADAFSELDDEVESVEGGDDEEDEEETEEAAQQRRQDAEASLRRQAQAEMAGAMLSHLSHMSSSIEHILGDYAMIEKRHERGRGPEGDAAGGPDCEERVLRDQLQRKHQNLLQRLREEAQGPPPVVQARLDAALEELELSRLQRRLDTVGSREQQGAHQEEQRGAALGRGDQVSPADTPPVQDSTTASHAKKHNTNRSSSHTILTTRQRWAQLRGRMPPQTVTRLLEQRRRMHETVRFNERLWNNSSMSPHAFAARITSVLAEDLVAEVAAEVDDMIGGYVDGMVQHELEM